MTITFQGHIKSIDMASAPNGKIAVTIRLPMAEADGKELTIFVPTSEGALWLPGQVVSITAYTLR